jgi:hypothetical protein
MFSSRAEPAFSSFHYHQEIDITCSECPMTDVSGHHAPNDKLSSRAESISTSLSFIRPIPIAISSHAVCSSAMFDEYFYIEIRTRGA